jgi:hypothetical protein
LYMNQTGFLLEESVAFHNYLVSQNFRDETLFKWVYEMQHYQFYADQLVFILFFVMFPRDQSFYILLVLCVTSILNAVLN